MPRPTGYEHLTRRQPFGRPSEQRPPSWRGRLGGIAANLLVAVIAGIAVWTYQQHVSAGRDLSREIARLEHDADIINRILPPAAAIFAGEPDATIGWAKARAEMERLRTTLFPTEAGTDAVFDEFLTNCWHFRYRNADGSIDDGLHYLNLVGSFLGNARGASIGVSYAPFARKLARDIVTEAAQRKDRDVFFVGYNRLIDLLPSERFIEHRTGASFL